MAVNTSKIVHSLILDSGPIIKNNPQVSTLLNQAEVLYTIPSVIDEIRDATTRARVESTLLPFLTLRSPKPASIKFIQSFAQKTGDLEVLSRPDLHLLALAYELECERNHGDWRLRSVPGQKRINGAPPESLKASISVSAKEDVVAAPKETNDEVTPAKEDNTVLEKEDGKAVSAKEVIEAVPKETNDEVSPAKEDNTVLEKEDEKAMSAKEVIEATPEQIDDEAVPPKEGDMVPEKKDRKAILEKKDDKTIASTTSKISNKTIQVALITTDYAMQNILLRLNLNLFSSSLQRISQLKTWVLRCHGCFSISKDMTKQFCGRCGKPTLLRTACSTDKDGTFRVHLKKNMQWNTRGNVYSIPKPVAGTSNGKLVTGGGKGGWGNSLILAEDQKEYVRAMIGEQRMKKKDLMDEDYLPALLSGDRGRAGGKPKVGAGRNVNSKKRR